MHRRLLRKRATVAVFVALAVALAGTAPAQGEIDPRERKGQVAQQQTAVAGQIDLLTASAADVQAGLAELSARVAAAEAILAEARAAADAARAVLAAAVQRQAEAQALVEQRLQRLREVAVDAYVHLDARTAVAAESMGAESGKVDERAMRLALAGFRADQDDIVLQQLVLAQQDLAAATSAAQAAADAAAADEATAQAKADAVEGERNQQASYAADVERRLDAKLAEAAALRNLDRSLSDQIAAQERALAAQVTPPKASKPPPPPGSENVVAPPPPARPDLVTTHGITVARSIAEKLGAMIDAAAADGVSLTGSGYRDYSSQVALRRQNCGPTAYDIYERPPSECSPPTARPGQSNHERGLAVDFAAGGHAIVSHTDPGWIWLDAHASKYGFFNLDSEPWHWSVDGA